MRGGYHVTNVLLHAVNAVLLLLVLPAATARLWPSAVVACLFAWHPLQVESVAWITERKDVLSALFWMLSLQAYVSWVRGHAGARYRSLLFFSLGLMAKPMIVTLPFVLLLVDVWPLGRACLAGQDARRHRTIQALVMEKVPFFALSLFFGGLTIFAQARAGSVANIDNLPLADRLGNAALSYVLYLGKIFWPARLAVLYPYVTLQLAEVGAALAVLAIVSMAVIRRRSKRPYLSVGWFWYLGTLVPVIGLVQSGEQAMADRFTYLPIIGMFMLVVWGSSDLMARARRAQTGQLWMAIAVLAVCLVRTRSQLVLWRDDVVLFEHALAVTSENPIIEGALAKQLVDRDRIPEAIAHFREALRVRPHDSRIHNNFAIALSRTGQLAPAVAQFEEALRLDPQFAEPHNNLGLALARQDRLADATEHFREAVRLKPDYADAHVNLGYALGAASPQLAIQHYREALRLQPESLRALNNLAWLLAANPDARVRDPADAVRLAERACALTGYGRPEPLDALAASYAAAGRFDEAVRTASGALDIAQRSSSPALAEVIAERLEIYRSGRPFLISDR